MFFPPQLTEALGYTVLHSLWQAALIALLYFIFITATNEQRARIRYLLANLGLLLLVMISVSTFIFYYPSIETVALNENVIIVPSAKEIVLPVSESPPTDFNVSWYAFLRPYLPTVVLIWLVGMLLFALRLVGSLVYLQYIKRRHLYPLAEQWQQRVQHLTQQLGINKKITVFSSALVRAPQVIGYLKPIILFPVGTVNSLTVEQVEAVLLHELAHIQRHDFLFNLLQSVVEMLYYFNPAVWVLSRHIRTEREKCCDDLVLKNGSQSLVYANALLILQEQQFYYNSMAIQLVGSHKSQLYQRVQRILSPHSSTKFSAMKKIFSIVTITLCLSIISFFYYQKTVQAQSKKESRDLELMDALHHKNDAYLRNNPNARIDDTFFRETLRSATNTNDLDSMEIYLSVFELEVNGIKQSSEAHRIVLQTYNRLDGRYVDENCSVEMKIIREVTEEENPEVVTDSLPAATTIYPSDEYLDQHPNEPVDFGYFMRQIRKELAMDDNNVCEDEIYLDYDNLLVDGVAQAAATHQKILKVYQRTKSGDGINANGGSFTLNCTALKQYAPTRAFVGFPEDMVGVEKITYIKTHLISAMLDERLLSEEEGYMVRLTPESLSINNTIQPVALQQKYLNLYENLTGEKLEFGDYFTISDFSKEKRLRPLTFNGYISNAADYDFNDRRDYLVNYLIKKGVIASGKFKIELSPAALILDGEEQPEYLLRECLSIYNNYHKDADKYLLPNQKMIYQMDCDG